MDKKQFFVCESVDQSQRKHRFFSLWPDSLVKSCVAEFLNFLVLGLCGSCSCNVVSLQLLLTQANVVLEESEEVAALIPVVPTC